MRNVVFLALRALRHDRIHVICNIAILAGVLVPLLVLFGVKNGVYDTLIGRLLSNPATLQIDTSGNAAFTEADAAEIRGWPETGFVTLKTRSIFDFVNVRAVGGTQRRDALLVPSGPGDPNLPAGLDLAPGRAAISAGLATQLGLAQGDRIEIFTQAEDRPRQLRLELAVAAVLPADRMSGRSVLATLEALDLVEAFYDGYALPDHGIEAGRALASRQPVFEGMRAYAARLEDLAGLQARIETRFGIGTEARTREVESVLGLGRNLDIALGLTVAVACIGLSAALVFGFWGEVARKRRLLAVLALMGLGGRSLWLFPVVQALVSAALGLAVSFGLYLLAALAAQQLFAPGAETGRLAQIAPWQAAAICLAVLAFVAAASLFAARAAARVDPAEVLREGGE
ncbi:ABC transporter permease [Poseidonocella sp. HB161398]|uniref:ABC transporter permease n=1 Tax=Poseidonocella sp. HB161398 TaxID=2320855 RepID=UPI0011081505|nr:ABC transporter permease [Poseidonocella sp. HB161398]